MFVRVRSVSLVAMLALVIAASNGCDFLSKKASEVKKVATDTSQRVVEKVKQETNNAGNIELNMGGGTPLKTSGCYGSFVSLGGGRGGVFQISSYADAAAESFPSLMFWASVPANSFPASTAPYGQSPIDPSALANQTLKGSLYVQQQPDGPVWHTADGDAATLAIQTAANGQFTAALAGSKLVNTETAETRDVSGSLTGSLK